MVITIDGAAGSGKSTCARKLAARLGIAYLDTGAMYRAVAHAALERGVDLRDAEKLLRLAASLDLVLDCGPTYTRVKVDGRDVSEAIRTMPVSAVISHVARHQAIRQLLVDEQRRIGQRLQSFVSEGRDQGSIVFPDADVKFVLEATAERRAERRYQEMLADGEEVSYQQVLENLRARDALDSKQWESLLGNRSTVIIDTTDMPVAHVVDEMTAVVQQRCREGARSTVPSRADS